MTTERFKQRTNQEVLDFIEGRKSLQLASLTDDGYPYASYAPFAIGNDCLYVLLSEIAIHALNLKQNPRAGVLIIEDEDSAKELFARVRVNYKANVELIDRADTDAWKEGVDLLVACHGERPEKLSQLADFFLFKLIPQGGRYVKGFGRAFSLAGNSLAGEEVEHLKDGHRQIKKEDDDS